jgi:signal transduction histidine kinase/DNA-binding response OmpR family regulator
MDPTPPEDRGTTTSFLTGGGELGALIRGFDWPNTPLGPPANWPQSLRTAVRIMMNSLQPIWIGWGEKFIYLYNDAYKSIIGGRHPSALGRPAAEVWPETWSQIGPMLHTALGGAVGTYVESQLLIMERNGYPEETYYTWSYTPIPNDDGRPGGIFCSNTDDTLRVIGARQMAFLHELAARTANARTLQEAYERSAEALASDPRDFPFAMLYVADPDGRTLSLAALCGIEREHAAVPETILIDGSSVWPVAEALQTREPHLCDLGAMFRTDLPTGPWRQPPAQAVIFRIPSSGQTGRESVLIAALNPFRLYDESFQGFLTLAAGQIAAAVANAQVHADARKRADALAEIDRAKTVFFSNASHEFRTPLALMISPLEEMLVRNAISNHIVAARHEVELIYRNGLRLLKLVNTLLDFSRIEAGRTQAVYELIDLSVYTAEIASSFRSAMEKAELDFIVHCPPLHVPAYVDRDMWEKIVLNLLSNAFKYTFEGEVAAVLRLSTDSKMLELTVRDTGVGVPTEELPRLFERFHRVEGQRGRSMEGTGIGLALVQELTRLHGGTVRAESVLGRGTSFTVAIPAGSNHLPPDRVGGQRTAPSTSVQAEAFVNEALRWLPGAKDGIEIIERELIAPRRTTVTLADRPLILVADDNTDMRDYVSRLLSSRYEVETVHDGLVALEAARRRRPNLILTDIMMPRLDGVGLLRALRSDSTLCDVPVVLLSARAGEDAKVEGLEAGADDYILKPFNARELLARIGATLEMARIRQEAANELRKLNDELEQRVELRAQQIEQTFARLHESEHRFRLLVEGVSDYAIYMLDSELDFGRFRPRMREHSPCGARYGLEFLYGLGVAGT